jgi:hypothetical protein
MLYTCVNKYMDGYSTVRGLCWRCAGVGIQEVPLGWNLAVHHCLALSIAGWRTEGIGGVHDYPGRE